MFNRLILTDSLYADLFICMFNRLILTDFYMPTCMFNRLILTDSLYADLYVLTDLF